MICQVDLLTSSCLFRQLCRLVKCYVNWTRQMKMSTCQILMLTLCHLSDNFVVICMAEKNHFWRLIFKQMNKWQVNIKTWQVNIKIWQDYIKIWQVKIIIWQLTSLSDNIWQKYATTEELQFSISYLWTWIL